MTTLDEKYFTIHSAGLSYYFNGLIDGFSDRYVKAEGFVVVDAEDPRYKFKVIYD